MRGTTKGTMNTTPAPIIIGCVSGRELPSLSPAQEHQLRRRKRRYRDAAIAARLAGQMYGVESSQAIAARRTRNDLSYELAERLGWEAVDKISDDALASIK